MLTSISSFGHDVLVDVILVGFQGLGLPALQRLFSTASNSHWNAHQIFGLDGVPLNVTNHLLFSVSRASQQLQADIDSARRAGVLKARSIPELSMPSHEGDSHLLLIDPQPIADLLAADYKRRGVNGAAIYVLDEPAETNNNIKRANDDDSQDNDDDDDLPLFAYFDDQPFINENIRHTEHPCPYSTSAGHRGSTDPRLIWIDLAAGPLRYGPSSSGTGTVTHVTFPSAFEEVLHTTEKPASAAEEKRVWVERSEFLVSLAVLLQKTAQQLLVPSVYRASPSAMQMRPWESLRFKLYWVREVPPARLDDQEVVARFNASIVEELIAEELGWFDDLPVHFDMRERATPLGGVFELSYAYFESLRTTTNAHGDLERHLDGAALHRHLRKWLGLDSHKPVDDHKAVVPIFLFDFLSPSVTLFESKQRLQVFDDMAVLLRFPSGKITYPLKCESRIVSTSGNEIMRPLLSALLTTGWNIAPIDQFWDEAHSRPAQEYLWAVSRTPFGEMSNALTLSFYHADLAKRNHIYTRVSSQQRRLLAHLRPLSLTGFHLHDLLPTRRFELYTQRWNVLLFKLQQASVFLSMQNYASALKFVRSAEHDTIVIEGLLREARASIQTSLTCDRRTTAGASAQPLARTGWFDVFFGPVLSFFLVAFLATRLYSSRAKN